jgi:hypothetical protein
MLARQSRLADSIGRGEHDERARLQKNFRGWILRYVCNATADSEVPPSFRGCRFAGHPRVSRRRNREDVDSCFSFKPEELSTRCDGQGVTVFFGMAKPVRAPQIGPARPVE